MSDPKLLIFGALAVIGLAYCLWKTQQDARTGLSWAVIWGVAASLSAFVLVAFVFAASLFKRL
jgi:hypothetical protein